MSGEDGDTEHIVLVGIRVEPNNCPIEEELTLTMDFDTKVDVLGGRWEVRFIADTASKRKIVCLGQTAEQDYHAGQHQMAFTVDRIDVSHLKRHVLANVGLLTASLYDHNNVEYVQVNMVTQVSSWCTRATLSRALARLAHVLARLLTIASYAASRRSHKVACPH